MSISGSISIEEMQRELRLTTLDIEDLSEICVHLRAFMQDSREEPKRRFAFSADILRWDYYLAEAYRLKLAIEKQIKSANSESEAK